ncbi:MAG: D-aminoacylase [Isosphaeraceae bacterium]
MTAAFLAFACALAAPPPADEPYDLVLRNGRIVDGTGNPWYRGDLAIRGDRIVALGLVPAEGRQAIDASGLIVSPGFIDIHSHSDWLLLEDGAAASKIRQGVTTEVLGEHASAGPFLGKLNAKEVKVGGETVALRRLRDYLEALERSGIALNVATYVGLGNVWGSVMGEGFDRPTEAEFASMEKILDEALLDGGFGLSTMLADPQGSLATLDDLVRLAKVVHRRGGSYSSHIRNEGEGVFNSVREAIAIGEKSGAPVDIIHLKIADQRLWGRMDEIASLIAAARDRGVDVRANVYPYTRGNNDLASIVPPWAHEGGRPAMLERLRDPGLRDRMKKEIRDGLPGWYNHYLAVGGDWSRMLLSAKLTPANKRFEGQAMDAILKARADGKELDPLDQLFDFLLEENGSIGTIYAHHTEEDMNVALLQPWCSIGSDGSAFAIDGPLRRGHPHPRSFGTFPRVLGVYVRERGLLRLEDAVRKMTSLNANKLGLIDRGVLRPGMKADVTVFDPDTVIDRSAYLEPFQYAEGIRFVIVNGRVALRDGRPTPERAGRALRRGDQAG